VPFDRSLVALLLLGSALAAPPLARAQDPATPPPAANPAETPGTDAPVVDESPVAEPELDDVEALVERARPSIVEVTFSGRDGTRQGLGTGFVVDANGLIATNLHVIGEARPIRVKLADGSEHAVQSVYATERKHDLAVLKIDATDLPALPLGKSSEVKPGRRIVAIGNPRGLRYSVVEGVVSARREVEGRPMLQIAMPIEPGNSCGPVIDRDGRVLGIVTLKSIVTRNLGFAVEIDALAPLLEKPNPVPIERWLTIGRLDPRTWRPLFGSTWRQRAGRITVDGPGGGFGGRSLCLHEQRPPEGPFEVAVTVKLGDESGAAGLVLHSDGNEKHYGFYPSDGQIRFSRFDGPDVFAWNVLHQIRTPHYRPGEPNTLKLRVEADRILGYVNGHEVVEVRDRVYVDGLVGLCKFRETEARFERFRLANEVPGDRPSPKVVAALEELIADVPAMRPPTVALVDEVTSLEEAAGAHLRERAREMERRAERLRQLAREAHVARVRRELVAELDRPDGERDLLRAALLLARMENEAVDVDAYLAQVDRIASQVRETLPEDAPPAERLAALDAMLFEQLGFHGSRTNYYSAANSHLDEVIDDREGLPITLSVLYLELARRLGLNVVGVGLPGHFVVRFEPGEGESQLIDVYDSGARLTRDDVVRKIRDTAGIPFEKDHLRGWSDREIAERIVQNLLNAARRAEDLEAMLTHVETLVALDRESGPHRFLRAVLRFNTGRLDEAHADTTALLANPPANLDLDNVRDLHDLLETSLATDEPGNGR
jgi:serine protease Do